MNDRSSKNIFENMLKIGTPECAVFSAVAAMVLGLLFLVLGFWRTLLIAVLMAIGAFLGGVQNKRDWLKKAINRVFPAKTMVPYREQNPEITRAVRKAMAEKQEEAQDDFTGEDQADDQE